MSADHDAADVPREPDLAVTDAGTPVPVKKKKKNKKKRSGSGLGSSRGVETMFRTSYRVHMELSTLADSKANIMISINGLIMSIILASVSPKIDSNPWLLAPSSVLLLACLVSIVYAVLAARPRVTSSLVTVDDIREKRANILFFGHFTGMSMANFETAMTELIADVDGLYPLMVRDLYGLGTVLQKKFALLRISYSVFMVGLIAGISLYLIVFAQVVFFRG